MNTKEIEVKIKKLPSHLIAEVANFIDFLLNKYRLDAAKQPEKSFSFDWEGDLSALKDQYSSVELQHKAMDWR